MLEVGACPPPPLLLAGPENPRKERGGGMRDPVLLRLRPWLRGGPPRSEKRGTTGGSAASGTKSVCVV